MFICIQEKDDKEFYIKIFCCVNPRSIAIKRTFVSSVCSGNPAKVFGVGGDRGETETTGAGHQLLHRLLAAAADHRADHFRHAADLHSHGAACR